MALTFEWDEEKAKRNFKKHGITLEEARTVFNDPFAITIADPDHSDEEGRYLDIGLSVKEEVLVVWYTEREENIRIIGCRRATPFERKIYEEREERF
jgi:uncharacterized DUF497 family protein